MPNLFAEGAFGFYGGTIRQHRLAVEGAERLEDLRANGQQLTQQQQEELRNFKKAAVAFSAHLKKAYGITIKSANDLTEGGIRSMQSIKGIFSLVGGFMFAAIGAAKRAHTNNINFPTPVRNRLGLGTP